MLLLPLLFPAQKCFKSRVDLRLHQAESQKIVVDICCL